MERLRMRGGRSKATLDQVKESLINRLIHEVQLHDEKMQIRHELRGIERDENGRAMNEEDCKRLSRLYFRRKLVISKLNTSRDYQRKLVRKHFLKEVGNE